MQPPHRPDRRAVPDPPAGVRARTARLAPTRTVLPNGVVVVAKETRKTPAVTINIATHAGTVCDPADAHGASYLLSRVIDRGTARRSAEAVAEVLESRGTTLSVAVNRHQLSLVSTCLAADFEVVLALLAEILIEPSLPDAEVALRKREVLTAIAQDEDSPYVKAIQELLSLLYGASHPYGRRAKGTPASIGVLTRDTLAALHRRHVTPAGVSLVVVGDVEPALVADVAARVFGGWTAAGAPEPAIPAPVPASARQRLVVPMMSKSQADIAYGFTAIRRSDPAYHACSLMNNAFGQYAMGGRLGDSIRERQGMAYYVSSALDANLVEGPLVIRAGVSPANVDRAVASIDEEIRRLRAEGITERELTESRQYLIGSMPRALETNAGIAGFLQNAEVFGLGLDYDVRLAEHLGAVTRDDVHAAALRLLDPERAAIVIAGPYGEGRHSR